MKTKKVLKRKYFPAKPPVILTVVAFIAADHWHFSEVWRGVMYCFLGLAWIGYVVTLWNEEDCSPTEVDVESDKEFLEKLARKK